jgi:hypothetical protein
LAVSSAGRASDFDSECRKFDPCTVCQVFSVQAEVVERRPHKAVVGGSYPPWTTKFFASLAQLDQSTGLRNRGLHVRIVCEAPVSFLGVAQLAERVLWEHEARGSRPLTETIFLHR